MNISILVKKFLIRLFLIVIILPLQSCSNTLIGKKLENSFGTIEDSENSVNADEKRLSINQKTKINLKTNEDKKQNEKDIGNVIQGNSLSNKDRLSQKTTKLIKKTIFNPQPYRIILRLSGANPAAPAETVTEALRKAGVQFEVEKIERFNDENLSKDTSLKR